MATRLYGIYPTASQESVVQNVGSAATSAPINFTVDLATTIITDNGTTRTISKQEVLDALEKLENYIVSNIWPPA